MWWMTSAALAASVYVNGVNVDSLRSQTFENATVTIDAKGDVLIHAPGYKIEVLGSGTMTATGGAAAAGSVATAATGGTTTVTSGATGGGTVTSSQKAANPAGVRAGRWWLVTEDNGSRGHLINVYVNDNLVQTVRSGEGQMIVDVGAWMAPGQNRVRIESTSSGASGGTLYVYIGSGNNDSGTVVLDKPEIQYGLGASRQGPYARDYTIELPR